jgi:hypothetical protein
MALLFIFFVLSFDRFIYYMQIHYYNYNIAFTLFLNLYHLAK